MSMSIQPQVRSVEQDDFAKWVEQEMPVWRNWTSSQADVSNLRRPIDPKQVFGNTVLVEDHEKDFAKWLEEGMPLETSSNIPKILAVAVLAFTGYQAGKWLWNRYHTHTPLNTTPSVIESKEPVAGENKKPVFIDTNSLRAYFQDIWNKYPPVLFQAGQWIRNRVFTAKITEVKEPVAGANKEALELQQAYKEYEEATPETKAAKGTKLQQVWDQYQQQALIQWEESIHQQILLESGEGVDNVENNNTSDSR